MSAASRSSVALVRVFCQQHTFIPEHEGAIGAAFLLTQKRFTSSVAARQQQQLPIPAQSLAGTDAGVGNHATSPLSSTSAFTNHKLAYGHCSTSQLVRAYVVLRLCRYQRVTSNASRLASFGSRVLGQKLFSSLMRASFFGHFTGAENVQDVSTRIEQMYRQHNVRPILHYHAERELGVCANARERAEAVANNVALTIESIRIVHELAPDGFAAVKITALFDPQVLAKLTEFLVSMRQQKYQDSRIATQQTENSALQEFEYMKTLTELSSRNSHSSSNNNKNLSSCLAVEELDEFRESWKQLTRIVDIAKDLTVRIFIDAEQTWLQPAIAQLALLAMQYCGQREGELPILWSTLQCYLQDAEQTYQNFLHISKKHNFLYATKFVRGAYLRSERERATTMSYECALLPSYEATNSNYDRIAQLALQQQKNPDPTSAREEAGGLKVAFATHNEDSIRKIISTMKNQKINSNCVAFGQLYGMCDRITYELANTGYTVLKVVPYGPVPLLTPYFVRRAEENSLMLGRCQKDLQMVRNELWQRLTLRRRGQEENIMNNASTVKAT